jgi:hypothetical protein
MTNLFNILNEALDSINGNFRLELCIQVFFCRSLYIFKYNDCNYVLRTTSDIRFKTKSDVLRYILITYDISSIKIYGSLRGFYNTEILYDFKINSINIIQRVYRKYRLRTAKIRNDLVIRGLSEYFYHPSKIDFDNF